MTDLALGMNRDAYRSIRAKLPMLVKNFQVCCSWRYSVFSLVYYCLIGNCKKEDSISGKTWGLIWLY